MYPVDGAITTNATPCPTKCGHPVDGVQHTLLHPTLIFFVALFIGTSVLTATHFYTHYMTDRIVIIQAKVELREGPSQSLETTLLLHEGVQATILKQNDTWSFIRCDNNITGWLPKSSFLSI